MRGETAQCGIGAEETEDGEAEGHMSAKLCLSRVTVPSSSASSLVSPQLKAWYLWYVAVVNLGAGYGALDRTLLEASLGISIWLLVRMRW